MNFTVQAGIIKMLETVEDTMPTNLGVCGGKLCSPNLESVEEILFPGLSPPGGSHCANMVAEATAAAA